MLDKKGFDQWAGIYDESISKGSEGYPFEGYYNVLAYVHSMIENPEEKKILDIGVGTGLLTLLLYKKGSHIFGIDFSEKMIAEARKKMPNGRFYCHDFNQGIPQEMSHMKFDYIVSSYAIHHLKDEGKLKLIKELMGVLNGRGAIIFADIAFPSREALLKCKREHESEWDDSEAYIVADELMAVLKEEGFQCSYHQISSCGGILTVAPYPPNEASL